MRDLQLRCSIGRQEARERMTTLAGWAWQDRVHRKPDPQSAFSAMTLLAFVQETLTLRFDPLS